ncbi:retinoblastoma-binding protein 1-like protein, partial [Reticulomyxa filosa]
MTSTRRHARQRDTSKLLDEIVEEENGEQAQTKGTKNKDDMDTRAPPSTKTGASLTTTEAPKNVQKNEKARGSEATIHLSEEEEDHGEDKSEKSGCDSDPEQISPKDDYNEH